MRAFSVHVKNVSKIIIKETVLIFVSAIFTTNWVENVCFVLFVKITVMIIIAIAWQKYQVFLYCL